VAPQVASLPQAALQQRTRQAPELHSAAPPHSSPSARLPQLPPTHTGEPPGHAVVLGVLVQVPAPSQVFSTMASPAPLQTLGGQVVPAAWKLQTPVALQPTSVQEFGVGQLQQRRGLPTQLPAEHSPVAVQEPPGAVLQASFTQTFPAAQPSLLAGLQFLHMPDVHTLPAAQSPLPVHGAAPQAPV
jgi:hypothetical protein